MEYYKLVAVSGMPGLFEMINSKTDGAILKSLEDGTTRFVSSRIHTFSQLESIEIYTVRDNVNLADLFHAMEKSKDPLPNEKDAAAIRKYFEKVFPDMDFERVYPSDMKKMVKWFDILRKNKVEIKLREEEETPENENEPVEQEAVSEPEPKKKPAPAKKKTAAKKTTAKKGSGKNDG